MFLLSDTAFSFDGRVLTTVCMQASCLATERNVLSVNDVLSEVLRPVYILYILIKAEVKEKGNSLRCGIRLNWGA